MGKKERERANEEGEGGPSTKKKRHSLGNEEYAVSGGGGGGGGERNGVSVVNKKRWTSEEDAILRNHVETHGARNWNVVERLQRSGKSCRLRWLNHLKRGLKKDAFTEEEKILIYQLHAKHGNKWSLIASKLEGRTDNEIKNYWNTKIKKPQCGGLMLDFPNKRWQAIFHQQPFQASTPPHASDAPFFSGKLVCIAVGEEKKKKHCYTMCKMRSKILLRQLSKLNETFISLWPSGV
ncbi:Transcription factor GAMYB [Acorus gramineus]|uniref:Transcription factor GAMYB n=1 Tax=Acorus gramineus TaxID=55184 RepID=A0AAV9AAL7_ACOGR|nr:Transcription factor GAMYB [Acorus gramineus]